MDHDEFVNSVTYWSDKLARENQDIAPILKKLYSTACIDPLTTREKYQLREALTQMDVLSDLLKRDVATYKATPVKNLIARAIAAFGK